MNHEVTLCPTKKYSGSATILSGSEDTKPSNMLCRKVLIEYCTLQERSNSNTRVSERVNVHTWFVLQVSQSGYHLIDWFGQNHKELEDLH